MALMMTVMCLCGSLAAAEGSAENRITFRIQTREELLAEQGMSASAWEEFAQEARAAAEENPLTEETMVSANPEAVFHRADHRIFMIEHADFLGKLTDARGAYRAACALLPALGAAPEAELMLWSRLEVNGTVTWVFQQAFEGLTVLGGTLKIATDEAGSVSAVISSLSAEMPQVEGIRELTAVEAENLVREKLGEEAGDAVLPEYTMRAVIPADLDIHEEETQPDRLVWVVFSANPTAAGSGDLPYLAHYVDVRGEYLHASAVASPGDRAARGGYATEYTFENMEADTWTGVVKTVSGKEMKLSAPVVRDPEAGKWYLADPERKIAVGEFRPMVYEEQRLEMVSSEENAGWDDSTLITYANMIRIWDYYAEMGWKGPDGSGTPMLLLHGLSLENGEEIDNACYMGMINGWQCFGFGGETPFGEAMDVLAHEFTHCVTTATMNTNLYEGDLGAINEAMSDIMGNICEMTLDATEDTGWLLGEGLGEPIRSMADPHLFGQPEYVWDIYYGPEAGTPNEINDQGGVHSNSSLLNLVAARLCLDGGMTVREAAAFWLTAACGMTARTDYPQMVPLLRWVLGTSGNERYGECLNQLLEKTRMADADQLSELPEGQRQITLRLPETEAMKDPYWVLTALQIDTGKIGRIVGAGVNLGFAALLGDEEATRTASDEMMQTLDDMGLGQLVQTLLNHGEDSIEMMLEIARIRNEFFTEMVSWVSSEENTISAVMQQKPTIYMLMNMDPDTQEMRGLALLTGSEWIDLMSFTDSDDIMEQAGTLLQMLFSLPEMLEEPGETVKAVELPSAGLETLSLLPLDRDKEE